MAIRERGLTISNPLAVAGITAAGICRTLRYLFVSSLFFTALTASAVAVSSTLLQRIGFSLLPGKGIEIHMQFDGPPSEPTGYTTRQPARIILDLHGVQRGTTAKYHPLGGGNARSMTVIEAKDRTRLIISMADLVAYSTRLEGNQLIVLVEDANKSATEDINLRPGEQGVIAKPSAQNPVSKYRGEKSSFNFQDIEIRSVLQLIADLAGQNLVVSDTVSGRITLRLEQVPWDQALDIIMKTKGLGKRQVGNVLMIAPTHELAAREELEMKTRQQISQLAPLRTEFIEVKYAKAAEVFALFEGSHDGKGVLSGRGRVIVDERTNSIILTETTDRINAFRAVLDRLDVPVRQVLIEARIITANSQFSDALGVRWGGFGFDQINSGQQSGQVGASLTGLDEVRNTPSGIVFGSPDHLVVDLGVKGLGVTSFAIGLIDEKYLLDLEISALVSEGSAEVIARPKIITADKQEAIISSGVQIPYQEASSSGATSTSFISATLELSVQPQITPDDRIIMDLEIKQDTVGSVFNGVPSINTNNIKTQVLVDNGETIVLGGIFTTRETQSVTKTPLLGDLPFIGALFRRKITTDDKLELLIFITPTLIRDTHTSR